MFEYDIMRHMSRLKITFTLLSFFLFGWIPLSFGQPSSSTLLQNTLNQAATYNPANPNCFPGSNQRFGSSRQFQDPSPFTVDCPSGMSWGKCLQFKYKNKLQ